MSRKAAQPKTPKSPLPAPAGAKEIVVYESGSDLRLEVATDGETVWLNRNQMAKLFGRDVKTIGKHIANALSEELAQAAVAARFAPTRSPIPTVAKFATVQTEGGRRVVRQVEHYSLDVVLSVGYRVKSPQGILFRQWANYVLREMLLNKLDEIKRIGALERRMDATETDVGQLKRGMDYLVQQLSAPPPDPPRRRIGFAQSRR